VTAKKESPPAVYTIALGAIAILGFALVVYATHWGIATSSDSARYIRSARHVLGREAETPSPIEAPAEQAHYPPLYPTVLAAASLGGADPLDAARWVQALLMAANAVVAGEIVRRFTGSRAGALFVAAMVALSPSSLFVHTWALSEPLYLLLTLFSLGFLAAQLRNPRGRTVIAAGIFAGLSILTRYAGAAILPAGGVALLLARQRPWHRRLIDAAVFMAFGVLAPAAWSVRNRLVLGSSTNRVLAFHPIGFDHLIDAARTFCAWLFTTEPPTFAPRALPAVATLLVIALIVAAVIFARRSALAVVCLLFIAAFAVTLAVSISFVDFHTPADERILSPVYVASLLLTGVLLAGARSDPTSSRAIVSWSLAILFAIGCIARSAMTAKDLHDNGGGFAHVKWRTSPVLAALRDQVPRERLLYSNAPGAIYLLSGWPVVISIPAEYSASSRLPNDDYPQRLAQMTDDLRAGRALIVYLERYGSGRWYYPSGEQLKKRLGLHRLVHRSDGDIYDYVTPTTTDAIGAPATRQ
jgi:4-amino-4-deoxy-L-arabinose transferase-like glycosyltransferase